MPGDLAGAAVEEFGLVLDRAAAGSASGAGVYRARTAQGREVYLKVTPAERGRRARAAAHRELSFYRELAPTLPVRSPRLLDAVDDDRGVVLLLAASGTARDAGSWTRSMWEELGRALAALHGRTPPEGGTWRHPDSLSQALAAPDMAAVTAFWEPALPRPAEVAARAEELWAAGSGLPAALTHGDCHTGNILHADGQPVLCDWQEAAVGRPASDLTFLSLRAAPSGAVVPGVLLDAYADAGPVDRHTLERAVLAEELAMSVFLWPGHAGYLGPVATGRVHRRGRALAERCLGGRWG